MERVRTVLAWDYSVPPLLAAYEKAKRRSPAWRRRAGRSPPALSPAPED
jgi:hypothetical protein